MGRLHTAVQRSYHGVLATTLESAGDVDSETVGAHFEGAGNTDRAGVHYATAADVAAPCARVRASRASLSQVDRPAAGRWASPPRRFGSSSVMRWRTRAAARTRRRRYKASRRCIAHPAHRAAPHGGDAALHHRTHRRRARDLSRHHADAGIAHAEHRCRKCHVAARATTPPTRPRTPPVAPNPPRDFDRDLARLDTLWSVSTALSAVDVVGVASMQSQALLLALRAAEPRRLALCLAWEAVLVGTGGWSAAARAAELLANARSLAAHIGDTHAEGMVRLATAWIAFLQFRISETIEAALPAEAMFRERCTGVWWELGLTRTMMGWAHTHGGDTAGVTQCIHDYYGDARERGDLALVTNLEAVCLPYLDLVAGNVDGAAQHLAEALALWPHKGFHVQHVSLRFSETAMHLYRGDGRSAYAGFERDWPALRWSLQLQNQVTRVIMLEQRARSALAVGLVVARGA